MVDRFSATLRPAHSADTGPSGQAGQAGQAGTGGGPDGPGQESPRPAPRRPSPSPLWLVPIAGWAYLVYGFVRPFENPVLLSVFWIDAFLSVVVHGIQVVPALRHARPSGHGAVTTVALTMLLGATWWKRLPGDPERTAGPGARGGGAA